MQGIHEDNLGICRSVGGVCPHHDGSVILLVCGMDCRIQYLDPENLID